MMRKDLSFWEENSFLKQTDVAVIGGGIVGLSAAIFAKEKRPDLRVVVFDRDPFGFGGTTRNAGFACFGSPSEVLSDLATMGEAAVLDLLKMRWNGLKKLRQLLGDERIGYSNCGGIELFRTTEKPLSDACFEALPMLNNLLAEVTSSTTYIPFQEMARYGFRGFERGILNPLEGSIDTGQMAIALRKRAVSSGVELFSGISIDQIETRSSGCDLHLKHGHIHATQTLICTNGFAKSLLPELDVLPARNLVLMTAEIPSLPWQGTFHLHEGYFYFRNVGKRILIGGGRHLDTEWKGHHEQAVPMFIKEELIRILKEHVLPTSEVKITHEWTGYLGIGKERSVLLQSVDPHVHVAVRMGGMGVAIGAQIGSAVAEMALHHF